MKMSDFALTGNRILVEKIGFNLSNSEGTTLTSVSSGESVWVELIASTSADADLLDLYVMRVKTLQNINNS